LNRPSVVTGGGYGEAIGLCVFPTRTETLGVEFPGANTRFTGLGNSLAHRFSIRSEGHFKFDAGKRRRGKSLTVEKCRLDIARDHERASHSGARFEEHHPENYEEKAHGKSVMTF
jgi:hypothetical protein